MNYINELVKVSINNYVAVLALNNPPLNLITLQMSSELRDTLHKIENDPNVKVVVIKGRGNKAFSAGADIKEFPEVWDDVIGKKLMNENLAIDDIELLEKPVIASIEGNALGGGCEIAMACDIRVIGESSKIGCPEINLGVFPGSGGLYRLARLVGIAKAYEMLYLGEIISAAQALEIGLVNKITEDGKAEEEAIYLAKRIAEKPTAAIKLIKRGVRELWQKETENIFRKNLEFSKEIFKTKDCAEGVDAFINKREPQFGKDE